MSKLATGFRAPRPPGRPAVGRNGTADPRGLEDGAGRADPRPDATGLRAEAMFDGRAALGGLATVRRVVGRMLDGRMFDARFETGLGGRRPEGTTPEGRTPEGTIPEGSAFDGNPERTLDGSTLLGSTPTDEAASTLGRTLVIDDTGNPSDGAAAFTRLDSADTNLGGSLANALTMLGSAELKIGGANSGGSAPKNSESADCSGMGVVAVASGGKTVGRPKGLLKSCE